MTVVARIIGLQFAGVRWRTYVIVGVAKGVAKEIRRTPFPQLSDSVYGVWPIKPSTGQIDFQLVSVATVGIHERERSRFSCGI